MGRTVYLPIWMVDFDGKCRVNYMGFFGCGTFFPGKSLFSLQDARALFEPFLPCDDVQLRRVYLRLALKYHPDKHPKAMFCWGGSTWMLVLSSTQKVTNSTGSVVKLQISFNFQPYLQKWSNLTLHIFQGGGKPPNRFQIRISF